MNTQAQLDEETVLSRHQQISGPNVNDDGAYSYCWGVYGGMEWLVHPFEQQLIIRCGGPVAGSTNRKRAKGLACQSRYPVWQTLEIEGNKHPIDVVAWCGHPHVPFTTQNQRPHTSCAAGRFAATCKNLVAIFSPIASSPTFENYQTISWNIVRVLEDPRIGNVKSFSWSPDGRFFLVGSSTLSLWGIQTQRDGQPNWDRICEQWRLNRSIPCDVKKPSGASSDVSLAEFSPDGRLFASVEMYSPIVKVWYYDPSGIYDQFSFVALAHSCAVMDIQWRPRVGPVRVHRRKSNSLARIPSSQTLLTITRDGVVRLFQETSHVESFGFVLQVSLTPRINEWELGNSSEIRSAGWAMPLTSYDGLQWTDDTATYPHVHLTDAFSKWGEMNTGHGHYSGVDVNQEPELRIGTIPLVHSFRDWVVATTDTGSVILWEVQGASRLPSGKLRVVAKSMCDTFPSRVGPRRHLNFMEDLKKDDIPRYSWCRLQATFPHPVPVDVQLGFTTHNMKISPSDVDPDILDILCPGRFAGALWVAHCNLLELQTSKRVELSQQYKGFVDSVLPAIVGHSAPILSVSSSDSVANVWEADQPESAGTNTALDDGTPAMKRSSSLLNFRDSTFDPNPILSTVCERNRVLLWKVHDHLELGPLQLDGIVPLARWEDPKTSKTRAVQAFTLLINEQPVVLVAYSNGGVVAHYRSQVNHLTFSTDDDSVVEKEDLQAGLLKWDQEILVHPGNEKGVSGAGGFAVTANLESFSFLQREFYLTCVGKKGESMNVFRLTVQSVPVSFSSLRDSNRITITAKPLWSAVLTDPDSRVVAFTEPRGCSMVRPERVCIVCASADGTVRLWGARAGTEDEAELVPVYQFNAQTRAPAALRAVSTSWSGRIATLDDHGAVCVWESESNTPFYQLEKLVIPPGASSSRPVQVKLNSFGARCEILVVSRLLSAATLPLRSELDAPTNDSASVVFQQVDLFALENENVLTVSGAWGALCSGPVVGRLGLPHWGTRTLSWTRAGGLLTAVARGLHLHGGWTRHPITGTLAEELQFMRKRRSAFRNRQGGSLERLALRDAETQLEAMNCIGSIAATRQRSLPDYHPHSLSEFLNAGLVEPVRAVLVHLRGHVKRHVEDLRALYGDEVVRDRSLLRLHMPPVQLSQLLCVGHTQPIKFPTAAEPEAPWAAPHGGNAADLFADFDLPAPAPPARSAAAGLFGFGSDSEESEPDGASPSASVESQSDGSETDFGDLPALLPHVILDDLSPTDNLKLLAVVSVFQALHGSQSKPNTGTEASAMDAYGAQFLLVFRRFGIDKRLVAVSQRPRCLRTVDVCWAVHSDSQDAILDVILADTEEPYTWKVAQSHGAGLWVTSPIVARKLAERIAQAEYKTSETKDPFSCAMFYFALGKKQVVQGLFRLAKNVKVTELLSRDFSEPRWKKAAIKNAFALLQKHRTWEAVAFFLLAESYNDAISVCIKNLRDVQLALFIALLVESKNPDEGKSLRRSLTLDTLLPLALYAQDRWLVSLALTLLGEHTASVTVFSDWPSSASLSVEIPNTRNMEGVFDAILKDVQPEIVTTFDSSEPYFVQLRIQDPIVGGAGGEPNTHQSLSRTLAASLLRASCFLMNSGLPILAMKPLQDVWSLGILSHLPEESRPCEKWRDSLLRDLASESLLPILLHVRSKLLIATGVTRSGHTHHSVKHHLDRLKADFDAVDSFCQLSKATQVAKGLSHLCIRSHFHAALLIMLHPQVRGDAAPFKAHLSSIVSNLTTIGYAAAMNPLNDGRDGTLPPSRRIAAMVVVVMDSLAVLLDSKAFSEDTTAPSEAISKELWVAATCTAYFALFLAAIHMDQMGLVRAMVEHELRDTFDSTPRSVIPLAFREAAEKLSFDWYDHEEVLMQRTFDDDEALSGPEGDEVSMAVWAEVYCRRLLRLLLVRFMMEKLHQFGLACLGRDFEQLDPCPRHSEQFEGCTVFETLFESISWLCDSLLANLQSCRPPSRTSRGSLSIVDIKTIEGAHYIQGNSSNRGSPRNSSPTSASKHGVRLTIGGCAMLKPLARLIHDSFENNDEQYLWQHLKGRGYLRLMFAEVALRDQVMVQQQPDVIPRYTLQDSTEIYRKPGHLIMSCGIVQARPDVVQMGSESGIREINVDSSIRYRQRTPSRRSLLDNESSSWEESLNRFQKFEMLHQEQGIQFYDGMSALGTGELAQLLRGASADGNHSEPAKLRANEGLEQGEIAESYERWTSHEPVQLGPRGTGSFTASHSSRVPMLDRTRFLDVYQNRTRQQVCSLEKRRVTGARASHNTCCTKLAPHPFLPNYFAGGLDGSVLLWEVGHRDALARYVKKKESGWAPAFVTRVRSSADGDKVMAADNAGQLAIWKACDSRGEMLPQVGLKSNSKRTMDCAFLNGGTVVATAGQSATHRNLCVWDTLLPPRVCRVASVCCGASHGLYSMAYSDSYQQIVVGDGAGQLVSYDLRQRKVADVVQAAHAKSIMVLEWDVSGNYFASGSSDGSIKFWSLSSSRIQEVGCIPNIHPVHTFMNHPTSESMIFQRGTTDLMFTDRSMISCGADGTVKLTPKKNFMVL